MSLLEDVLAGALASGVNKPTLAILNIALLSCVLLLVGLLFLVSGSSPDLLPHLAVLLLFALGLIVSTNWLVGQLGTVSIKQQREELFGPSSGETQASEQQQGQQASVAQGSGSSPGEAPAQEGSKKEQ